MKIFKNLKVNKKQFTILLFSSLLISVLAISHGVFFDLDITQIKRLTFAGIIITMFITLFFLFFLEWVFDLDNNAKIEKLCKEIEDIKKRVR
ncbi:MAG: hypothetical protein GWO87_03560 [Xanthomonadaceae bacterium]|nr:hypothetical protein [Rhodospirillaceae bacterium]NIA18238.1 hypothetical protein [Xanthomonadaceae bacterium]